MVQNINERHPLYKGGKDHQCAIKQYGDYYTVYIHVHLYVLLLSDRNVKHYTIGMTNNSIYTV